MLGQQCKYYGQPRRKRKNRYTAHNYDGHTMQITGGDSLPWRFAQCRINNLRKLCMYTLYMHDPEYLTCLESIAKFWKSNWNFPDGAGKSICGHCKTYKINICSRANFQMLPNIENQNVMFNIWKLYTDPYALRPLAKSRTCTFDGRRFAICGNLSLG